GGGAMRPLPRALDEAVASRGSFEPVGVRKVSCCCGPGRAECTGVNMPAFRECCLESRSGIAAKPLAMSLVSLVVGGLLAGCVQDPLTQTSNRARTAMLAAGDPDSLAA